MQATPFSVPGSQELGPLLIIAPGAVQDEIVAGAALRGHPGQVLRVPVVQADIGAEGGDQGVSVGAGHGDHLRYTYNRKKTE